MQSPPLPTDLSVLLVEDDELIRECLAELLGDAGWRVTAAAGAEQALQWGEARTAPDVLVTDLCLGRPMNGLALIGAARRRWPLVPAVLMSGADLGEPVLAGGGRYLRKPFTGAALIQLIAELVRPCPMLDETIAAALEPGRLLVSAAGTSMEALLTPGHR